jgi:hypothetical protein
LRFVSLRAKAARWLTCNLRLLRESYEGDRYTDQLLRRTAQKKGADMKTLSKTFLATALRLCGFVMVPTKKENERAIQQQ